LVPSLSWAIFGGTKVELLPEKEQNFLKSNVIHLEVNKDGNSTPHTCTGVLIDAFTVLTAAHCLDNVDKVVAFKDEKSLDIEEMLIHKDYNELTAQSDFGLIIVREVKSLQKYAPLTAFDDKLLIDSVWVAGFGTDSQNPFVGSGEGILRRSQNLEVKALVATNIFGMIDDERFVLNQANGSGACAGDSGGPVFGHTNGSKEIKLLGIISFGDCKTFINVQKTNSLTFSKDMFRKL
jgi:secreted trypsin-like serine protease